MAMTHLGNPVNPKQLNLQLKQHGGYNRQGWLKWHVASQVTTNHILFDMPERPSHQAIDDALRSGWPVLAKIQLWNSVPHWVLILGKDGDEYLVKNPLCLEKSVQRLSELTDNIHAVRVVKGHHREQRP